MILIIGVVAICLLMALVDVKKILKMETGSTKTLVAYFTLMLAAIVLLCVFVYLGDFYLTDIFIKND